MRWQQIVLFVLVIAAFLPESSKGLQAEERPNILFVLFDDLGYGQPPSYRGESQFQLPNLDRLVAEGIRFTDAHSASAVCTPTRYGVLTGRYPWRIGQFGVCTTYSPPIIPTDRLTVAKMLQQEGYSTSCIGKWHLGLNWVDGKPGNEKKVPLGAKFTDGPNALGFDYFYGFTHARNIFTVLEQDRVVQHVEAIDNQPLMIKKAVEWLEQQSQSQKPFFMYFPMCPPHTPVVPPESFQGKSGAKDLVKKDPKYGDWVYYGDWMLGQLLETLEKNGVRENTLVIATSDNGAEGRPYPPLREAKRSIYEGGHRVPFVVRWPGKVEPGSINDQTVCLNDLFATAAEIVGADLPDGSAEDSFSFLPLLQGTVGKSKRTSTVHQSLYGDLAIRRGKWKLIFHADKTRVLFNLRRDLSETQDLFDEQQQQIAEMETEMNDLINSGRSRPGSAQKNEFQFNLEQGVRAGIHQQRNNKKQKKKS
ncbi:Steryl-sulfatase [Planctomycetales bacterium 10988]|nr:Steryl-sulfatase [Planctomycetales bacterium 10988]